MIGIWNKQNKTKHHIISLPFFSVIVLFHICESMISIDQQKKKWSIDYFCSGLFLLFRFSLFFFFFFKFHHFQTVFIIIIFTFFVVVEKLFYLFFGFSSSFCLNFFFLRFIHLWWVTVVDVYLVAWWFEYSKCFLCHVCLFFFFLRSLSLSTFIYRSFMVIWYLFSLG